MGFSILRYDLENWCDLSNYPGEGLLYYDCGETNIIVKLHALCKSVHAEDALNAYECRLRNEVPVSCIAKKCWNAGGVPWGVTVFDLGGTGYSIFACAVVDNRLCTVDAVLGSAERFVEFTSDFGKLIAAVDFSRLSSEQVVLECDGISVAVSSMSDMRLQKSTGDTLIFVGRYKYIVVTTNVGVHHKLLERAQEEFGLTVEQDGQAAIYHLNNDKGISSTVEVSFVCIDGRRLETFGYYMHGTDCRVGDNLSFVLLEECDV